MNYSSMFSVVRETVCTAQERKKGRGKTVNRSGYSKCSFSPHVELEDHLREQPPQLKLRNASLIPRENEKWSITPGAGQGRAGRGDAGEK